MDIFEYLPQLIVAYDGNDEFANLIHVKKANKDIDYYCPCCGGVVKPRALESTKEQSHYYHITGKCTKESQLHFFCKNWLFEIGSKFYINDRLFEVNDIEIEKTWYTKFGDYKPDVTVYTTSGEVIYFEMFFSNRKSGDDYFCKWYELGNDVVEVDIKEYTSKTDEDVIPSFTYLYHDGVCYSKPYQKKDLYANTIAKIKKDLSRQKLLNYKARIEQLDWFWQNVRNNSARESILESLSVMDYEDLLSCYEIIKRKQCVSYLKNDVLNMINQRVLNEVREKLYLPYDENIYFDLKHIRGRTYEAGIRLKFQSDHITYNDLYDSCNSYSFNKLSDFPKIVFNSSVFNINEIKVPEEEIVRLKEKIEKSKKYRDGLIEYEKVLSRFESENNYKIRVDNNLYTVLGKVHGDDFEIILNNFRMIEFDIDKLSEQIQFKLKEIKDQDFINFILNDASCQEMIYGLKAYRDLGCQVDIKCIHNYYNQTILFRLYFDNLLIYDKTMQSTMDDFIYHINQCKDSIDLFYNNYSMFLKIVEEINNCKNKLWKATITFENNHIVIKINQNLFEVEKTYLSTYEKIYFDLFEEYNEEEIQNRIKCAMYRVLDNMECCGYRVMEECA